MPLAVHDLNAPHSTINTGGESPAELRRAWERDFNIYTAETYVGLATQAFQQVR